MQANDTASSNALSTKAILLTTILFPPAGLVMLWLKRDTPTDKKLLGSVGIVALGVLYIFVLAKVGILSAIFTRPDADAESHYSALERHREQQKQEAENPGSTNSTEGTTAATSNPTNAPATTDAAKPATSTSTRTYWTNYRGPNRDGRYDEQKISTNWSAEGLKPIWKQPVGLGWASFVVADNLAYTIEQRRNLEVVAAYNIDNGREVWTQSWNAEFVESMGGNGPRATPTWDDGKLYALGATGELRCLDAKTGKVIWGKNILTDNGASNLQWGMAAAPLIVDDKVIVQPGGKNKSFVAYNKNTGAAMWHTLSDTQAYVSPMLATLAGKRQILAVTANRIVGINPDDGALLWDYPWDTQMGINCSQPIPISDTRFFISSGYGKGAALVDVSDSGGKLAARKIWENTNMKNKFNSSVILNGYAYGLDEGILTCVEVQTGERKWKGGRYGFGQIILASDHLIIISEQGELALVKATPDKYEEVTKFQALEGKTWNYPAIANGKLLVRNGNEMACFNLAMQ
ncbi:MAG: PQQ-binding-like beta-propeller repeat protein [Acidobacteriota bacterium]